MRFVGAQTAPESLEGFCISVLIGFFRVHVHETSGPMGVQLSRVYGDSQGTQLKGLSMFGFVVVFSFWPCEAMVE